MGSITQELVAALQFLLPGFVVAWVYYNLTSYIKPAQFERIIQALIFTIFVQALVGLMKGIALKIGEWKSLGQWSESSSLILSVLIALVVGTVISIVSKHDFVHERFRKLGWTLTDSFPSEWYGAFKKNVTYVVLHLEDGRRLFGWPIQWPTDPNEGHIVMQDPSWLVGADEKTIVGVKNILISASEVRWVEFLSENTANEENKPNS